MVLGWVFTGVGVVAFGHALIHRSDAFTAADTLTKPKWVAITAGATAAIALFGAISFLGIIGVVAVLVYLSATDQDGVDVAMVRQAQAELTAGRTAVAQQTLQLSIAAAVGQLKPASGEETGTAVVGAPLPGRGPLTGTDWTLGGVSLLLLAAGVGLALWFRPAENLAQLRRRLTTPVTGTDPDTETPPSPRNSPEGHQP